MRLRLWHRLFLAFAALSVLALLAFASWQQRAFHQGFLAYLDQVALDHLQSSTERFAEAYREQGSWAFLRGDPRRFDALVDGRGGVPVEPPPERRPPPDERRPPRDGPRPPRGPHPVSLVDAEGRFVAGDPRVDADAHVLPIEVDGRIVGRLRAQPLPRISGAQDVAFAQDQARGALLAVFVVLVGAFVAAFLLARWLLAPVRALTEGTHALAAGDFSRRVDASRRDELGMLAADFNRLAASLDQHREARRRWGADIAHELRTPLSILRGEVQALQDGVRAPSERAFASLDAECTRLASLVDDLYQLALADAGALEYRFEPTNLAALLREVAELQRRRCEDGGLRLELSIDPVPSLSGDARRLAQLVDNLLANARRYTDAPGTVRVSLAADAAGLLLAVEDSAPGVAPEHLPRLFDRLYRVEASRRRADGGAGLGLAICRAIVEAHGGRIEARRSALGGLRVEARLPLRGGVPA